MVAPQKMTILTQLQQFPSYNTHTGALRVTASPETCWTISSCDHHCPSAAPPVRQGQVTATCQGMAEDVCVCKPAVIKPGGTPSYSLAAPEEGAGKKKSQRNVFRSSSKSSRYHLCLSIAEWLLRCFHVKVRKLFSHHLSSLVLSAPSVTKSLQELPFPLPNPAQAEPPTFLQLYRYFCNLRAQKWYKGQG